MDDAAIVRPAASGDEEILAAMRWRWRVQEAGEAGADEASFCEAFATWVREHRATHRAFLALAGGENAGMAWLATVERIPGPARWTRLGGLVQSVWVAPAHRNRGVGAQLVAAVIDSGRQQGLDYLLVHPTPRSVPFYRRLGFDETAGHLQLDLR